MFRMRTALSLHEAMKNMKGLCLGENPKSRSSWPSWLHVTQVVAFVVCSTFLSAQGYVPNRVFDTARGAFSDFEAMSASLMSADVVLVGEQHDDANTHRLELAVLEGLARRGRPVVLSLEMFERDAQEPLDHFQMGHISEEEFLKASRPWPRYATDYKPLVDFAIAHNWSVVAANVPRAIASEVAKGGLDVLASKTGAEKAWFARDLVCPTGDEYFKRFVEAMGGHPAGTGSGTVADESARTTERYYQAQCVKDETMAESIAQAATAGAAAKAVVVHFNGAFHTDYHQGTAARVSRRLPGKTVVVLSILPRASLDKVTPDDDARRLADFVVYTINSEVVKK
jgi:uncharacterized iron-regulated protein